MDLVTHNGVAWCQGVTWEHYNMCVLLSFGGTSKSDFPTKFVQTLFTVKGLERIDDSGQRADGFWKTQVYSGCVPRS